MELQLTAKHKKLKRRWKTRKCGHDGETTDPAEENGCRRVCRVHGVLSREAVLEEALPGETSGGLRPRQAAAPLNNSTGQPSHDLEPVSVRQRNHHIRGEEKVRQRLSKCLRAFMKLVFITINVFFVL